MHTPTHSQITFRCCCEPGRPHPSCPVGFRIGSHDAGADISLQENHKDEAKRLEDRIVSLEKDIIELEDKLAAANEVIQLINLRIWAQSLSGNAAVEKIRKTVYEYLYPNTKPATIRIQTAPAEQKRGNTPTIVGKWSKSLGRIVSRQPR